MDGAVGCPQMAQEYGNANGRLVEDLRRDTLLVGAQPERAEIFEPDAHRTPHSVSQVLGRWQIDLDPRALVYNTRAD